jgi:thiamine biosynthesis lipoprotein ApbE
VIAATAAEAETLATATAVAGAAAGAELLESAGAAGLLVKADGTTMTAGPMDAFLR